MVVSGGKTEQGFLPEMSRVSELSERLPPVALSPHSPQTDRTLTRRPRLRRDTTSRACSSSGSAVSFVAALSTSRSTVLRSAN